MVIKIFLFIILFKILLGRNMALEVSYKGNFHRIIYNGIVWVLLDRHSIKKYKSNDTAIIWVNYSKGRYDI